MIERTLRATLMTKLVSFIVHVSFGNWQRACATLMNERT
jgi:hypothetical protein